MGAANGTCENNMRVRVALTWAAQSLGVVVSAMVFLVPQAKYRCAVLASSCFDETSMRTHDFTRMRVIPKQSPPAVQ